MNLETKIIIYKFTPQDFTLTQNSFYIFTRYGEMYILYLVRVVPHIEVHFRF